MTWGLVAVAGATLVGGALSSSAASSASKAQVQAADKSAEVQKQMFDKQVELQAPFREAGLTAQNRLLQLLGIGENTTGKEFGKYGRDFSMEDFQTDPGYGFRMSEGLKALDRQAAARGGLISGGALKAAIRYGQDAASQEYTNAFNRYQVNRNNQISPLQGFTGQAKDSANTLGQAAGNLGQSLTDTYTGAGNARASGYVGSANSWNQAIGGVTNLYMGQQYLNKMGA